MSWRDGPIKIFVGCASNNEDLESQAVLEHTLRKFASLDLDITWMQLSRDPASFWYSNREKGEGWDTKTWATPFSAFRWAIPAYCGFEGRAIYMDSDMIARTDIAALWKQEIMPQSAMLAKADGSIHFCVTLFDCERSRHHLPPLEQLRRGGQYRNVRRSLVNSQAVQKFAGNWNCRDLEDYKDINDPDIKIIHYTSIPHQVQLKHAAPRLAREGSRHWYTGEHRPHYRPELQDLFDRELDEAEAAGYGVERYRKEPFGNYYR